VGIADGQLRLHCQPIVALGTDQPASVEVLVRWQHPERGLLAPEEFMDIAERTGLVIPLGTWVLYEACRIAVDLQARREMAPTVSVNLSAKQLSDVRIVETVQAALTATGCTAARLVFEVTETALVTDMGSAVSSLRRLKELGARLAIDDFGTGYSTLLYLRQLPADLLKIDRSFISGLVGCPEDIALVASVISLAHNVNVRCVAEGVETAAQLGLLEQLGCDFAQGHLLSPPVDEAGLYAWLDHRPTGRRRHGRPSPTYAPETARILAMSEGGASLHTVAAALNIEGSRTVRGRRWSAETVAQVVGRAQRARQPRPV
jgi:EAL domain-containing protein (putative c-di-GMP-specific phosphodiesterase class I)